MEFGFRCCNALEYLSIKLDAAGRDGRGKGGRKEGRRRGKVRERRLERGREGKEKGWEGGGSKEGLIAECISARL